MASGTGYIAIAAVIFGKWTISDTVLACLLFGAATALQFQLVTLGIDVPNAFLIMLPYLLVLHHATLSVSAPCRQRIGWLTNGAASARRTLLPPIDDRR
jgi:ABC-type uncharacterized transport system permease subunit